MIKITWQQLRSKMNQWRQVTPTTAAKILNKVSLNADNLSRKNIKQAMNFRQSSTQVYTIGRPKAGGYTNAGVYRYPARLNKKRLADVRVIMGAKKNHPFLGIHNAGGNIKPSDQAYHYTAAARQRNSYRGLPTVQAKLSKGKRLSELPKNLSHRAHFAAMNKMRKSGLPFIARSRKIGGRKRRAGVYMFRSNRLVMLRGFQRQNIKIKASRWHDRAIQEATNGSSMHKIILDHMRALYKNQPKK